MEFRNIDQLKEYVNLGNKVKYVFFWGHNKKNSQPSKACFSQWYESRFSIDNITYMTAEHYMMAEKAKLFADAGCHQKILNASNPGEAKALGRQVKNFNEEIWNANRFEIVVRGNIEKFSQNEEIKNFLLNTGSRVLVEASPVDKVWGVGLAEDSEKIDNPNCWRGLNLLGFALMEVREKLRGIA